MWFFILLILTPDQTPRGPVMVGLFSSQAACEEVRHWTEHHVYSADVPWTSKCETRKP